MALRIPPAGQSRNCQRLLAAKSPDRKVGAFQTVKKSLAEFSAKAENKVQNIFCQGVYLTENTSQAASVEFVRL